MTATSYLGKPTSRIDGRAKVTGLAKYAAEYNVSGLAHCCVVSSAIAKGRIKRIHTEGAISKRDPAQSVARGNPAPAFEQAAVRIKAEYSMPVEHHNPMEPFAATAVWEGNDRITVFDKTQGPQNCRNYVAGVFGMPRDK